VNHRYCMNKTLTDSDNNSTINCAVGDTVDIMLSAKPSTGFLWQSTDVSAGKLIKMQYDATTSDDKPGASRNVRFRYLIEQSGTFALNYARQWDESATPIKWFSVSVVV
jgi:predicted secreted protein